MHPLNCTIRSLRSGSGCRELGPRWHAAGSCRSGRRYNPPNDR